jgi:glycine cleavage system H lipoate-binding protein
MTCPFLRETTVHGCRSAGIRKLIPQLRMGVPDSRCQSEAHRNCPLYQTGAEAEPAAVCPLLERSLVQYCGAAPVTKFVPYSEAVLLRCGNGSYRYCDLYLELTQASRAAAGEEGWEAPEDLQYTNNHWWIDLPDEGPWHAGIDAFLARMLGPVERISFLVTPRPGVVLTVAGHDFTAALPEAMPVSQCNLHLRSRLDRLTTKPYTQGWLFEGTVTPEQKRRLRSRLLPAADARKRMEADAQRMNEALSRRQTEALADGGLFEEGILGRLPREEAHSQFEEFCSPLAGRERDKES